jgi:hypothetical protein
MPTNVKIIHAHDFVRATPGGVLDRAASEQLLSDIARASAALYEFQILLDTRRALVVLDSADLWMLARKVTEQYRALMRKTAVLCPTERFNHARFFAMCTQSEGLNVRAFVNYEDAMEWLIADDTREAHAQA